jgi:hypothetical protein
MNADYAGMLSQYGAIGIMLVVVGFFAKKMVVREQVRADRLELEVTRLNTLVQERTIPALVAATEAIQASQQLLLTMQYQRESAQRVYTRRASGED